MIDSKDYSRDTNGRCEIPEIKVFVDSAMEKDTAVMVSMTSDGKYLDHVVLENLEKEKK